MFRLVQTLCDRAMQFYGPFAASTARSGIEPGHPPNFVPQLGGGAKIRWRPLRLRVASRIFSLRGEPRHRTFSNLRGVT